jgi:hypothetical protein
MRRPVFELHIRPLFRAIDRDHMLGRFDLWRYDEVVAAADQILARVASDMPTLATGGPWPEEWVELFRHWRETGFKRLELGDAQLSRSLAGTKFVINATGTLPAVGYRGWLELETATDTAKTYVLYLEAPDEPASGAAPPWQVRERYPATDTRRVFVRTNAGVKELPVAPTPTAAAVSAELDDRAFWLDDK